MRSQDAYLAEAQELLGYVLAQRDKTSRAYLNGLRAIKEIVARRLRERATNRPVCDAKVDINLRSKPVEVTVSLTKKIAASDWPTWEGFLRTVDGIEEASHTPNSSVITLEMGPYYRTQQEVGRVVAAMAKAVRLRVTGTALLEEPPSQD